MKTILLTGAFGNIGCYVVHALLAKGFSVRAFDLDNKENRKQAARFSAEAKLEQVWGDIRDQSTVQQLVEGVDAVIHLACIIPPTTEDLPDFTYAVNVTATEQLIQSCEQLARPPQFLYASSFTVFPVPDDRSQVHQLRTIEDPIRGSDHYTQQKVACEQALQVSSLNFMIGRIAVAIDENLRVADKRLVQAMMQVDANNPLEYVHQADIARAFVNAIDNPAAKRAVFLLGGGKHCQITQIQLVQALMGASGMRFSAQDLGNEPYYTQWLDTSDSQAVLNYQQVSFADYQAVVEHKMRFIKRLVSPIRGLAKLGFLLWLKF